MEQQALPQSEQLFRKRYKKSPSFISIHMGVKAGVLPQVTLRCAAYLLQCVTSGPFVATAVNNLCLSVCLSACMLMRIGFCL